MIRSGAPPPIPARPGSLGYITPPATSATTTPSAATVPLVANGNGASSGHGIHHGMNGFPHHGYRAAYARCNLSTLEIYISGANGNGISSSVLSSLTLPPSTVLPFTVASHSFEREHQILAAIGTRRAARRDREASRERKKRDDEAAVAREIDQQWRIARDIRDGEAAREREMKDAQLKEQAALAQRLASHRSTATNNDNAIAVAAVSSAVASLPLAAGGQGNGIYTNGFNGARRGSGATNNGSNGHYGPPVGLGGEGHDISSAPFTRTPSAGGGNGAIEGVPMSSQFLGRPTSVTYTPTNIPVIPSSTPHMPVAMPVSTIPSSVASSPSSSSSYLSPIAIPSISSPPPLIPIPASPSYGLSVAAIPSSSMLPSYTPSSSSYLDASLPRLLPAQASALSSFKATVGLDASYDSKSIRYLTLHNWDIHRAISSYMDHGDIDKATIIAVAAKEAADARLRKAKIQVTLPDNTIITKEFEQNDTLWSVYTWVGDEAARQWLGQPFSLSLASDVLTDAKLSMTLTHTGLANGGMLRAQRAAIMVP